VAIGTKQFKGESTCMSLGPAAGIPCPYVLVQLT